MTKYRKIATIKAEQFDYETWVHMRHDAYPMVFGDTAKDGGMMATNPVIPTLEGDMRVHDGDWIATGVNGNHWPIADEVFKKTYAELPVIPKGVARWIELTKQAGKSLGDMFVDYTPEQLTDADEGMISDWVGDNKNQTILANTLARAWLDGYQVEVDE